MLVDIRREIRSIKALFFIKIVYPKREIIVSIRLKINPKINFKIILFLSNYSNRDSKI